MAFSKGKNILLLIGSIIFVSSLIGGYFLYSFLSFSEEEAKDTVTYFFQMAKMNNVDTKIYPTYLKIENSLDLKKDMVINSANKNPSTGDFDVYIDYISDKNHKIPIVFNVTKSGGNVFIKSSRGLSFYLYNDISDFGIALGVLEGNEIDTKIASIVNKDSLEYRYQSLVDAEFMFARLLLKGNVNIPSSDYGSGLGSVVLINDNDFFFAGSDLNCKLDIYNSGQIIESKSITFPFGIQAKQSSTSSLFYLSSLVDGFDKYDCSLSINKTDRMKKIIKDGIISKINSGIIIKGEGRAMIYKGNDYNGDIILK